MVKAVDSDVVTGQRRTDTQISAMLIRIVLMSGVEHVFHQGWPFIKVLPAADGQKGTNP